MVKIAYQIACLAGLVYFTQGSLGLSGIALPLYLRNLGWSVSKISAISSFAAFPWVIKIFYGLLSDSVPIFGYRRRSYLLLSCIFSILGWLGLVVLPPETRYIFFAMSLSNLGFAATDVVTDGLIVEHSKGVLSSYFQSIAWGFRSLGSLLSGITGGWLAAHWPPKAVFLLTMLLPLPIIFFSLFVHEPKRQRLPFHMLYIPVLKCVELLKQGSIRWFICILVTLSVGSSFGVPFFFYMKETLGFKEKFLGILVSAGWAGAMLGSLIYVRWLRKVPMKKVLKFAILISSLNIFSALIIIKPISALAIIFIGGTMGCLSLLSIMTASAVLTHHTGVEGTFFAILMGIFNLGQIAFGYFGSKAYDFIGLQPLIILSGFGCLCGLFFVQKVEFQKAT